MPKNIRTRLLKPVIIAVSVLGVAGLGLATAGSALAAPTFSAVTVTATPGSFSGMVGTAISPVLVSTSTESFLSDATVTLAASGLPAGVSLTSSGGNGSIGGTPTAAGNGTATVTATAAKTYTVGRGDGDVDQLLPLPADYGCAYTSSIPGTFVISVSDGTTISAINVSVNSLTGEVSYQEQTEPSGAVTATATESIGEFVYQFGQDLSAPVTVTKTCTGSVNIPWAIGATSTPPAPPAPPAVTTVSAPSGGVQTGGGKASASTWLPVSIAVVFLGLIAIGGAAETARRARRQQG